MKAGTNSNDICMDKYKSDNFYFTMFTLMKNAWLITYLCLSGQTIDYLTAQVNGKLLILATLHRNSLYLSLFINNTQHVIKRFVTVFIQFC